MNNQELEVLADRTIELLQAQGFDCVRKGGFYDISSAIRAAIINAATLAASSEPFRLTLSRTKGWRMPPNTVKVDRTGKWGNPFCIGPNMTQEDCALNFDMLLSGFRRAETEAETDYLRMALRDREELRGKNLACWCKAGTKCHADILLIFCNGEKTK